MHDGFFNQNYYWEQTENQILTCDEYAGVHGEDRDSRFMHIMRASFNSTVAKYAQGEGGTVPVANTTTNPFGRNLNANDRSTQRYASIS